MPTILFKLRNVPDDEADEIRELLRSNNIEFYETPAGRWGISMEAIWLPDESRMEEAKQLINNYQVDRSQRTRQEYQNLKEQGQAETFIQRLIHRPVQVFALLALIATILYFVTMPFIKLSVD